MRWFKRRRRLGERGSVAVEFAYVGPLLLVFSYGIIEVGHYMFVRVDVANAALDGARVGALASGSSINTQVDNDLNSAGLNASNATVTTCYYPAGSTTCGSTSATGDSVQVTVSYPYQPLMPGFGSMVMPGAKITLANLVGPIVGQGEWVIPAPQT